MGIERINHSRERGTKTGDRIIKIFVRATADHERRRLFITTQGINVSPNSCSEQRKGHQRNHNQPLSAPIWEKPTTIFLVEAAREFAMGLQLRSLLEKYPVHLLK